MEVRLLTQSWLSRLLEGFGQGSAQVLPYQTPMFLVLSSCTLVRAEDGMLIQQGFGEVVLVIRNSHANDRDLLVTIF